MGVTLRRNSCPVKINPFYNFNPNSGYFGQYEDGNKSKTRIVYTDNDPIVETKALFDQLAKGAIVKEDVPNKMWHATLEDGSKITLRINHPTPEHAPAVMISVRQSTDNAGIKTQKIHFIKKGDKKWKI